MNFEGLAEEFVLRVCQARERACEVAIQIGVCGVLEIHELNGGVTFEVSHLVPYGEIHVIEA